MRTLITISFSLYLYFKAVKLHGTPCIDTAWQSIAYVQTKYEQRLREWLQINTFSLTSQTTSLVVFKHQLGLKALDTTELKQTRSTALDPGQLG